MNDKTLGDIRQKSNIELIDVLASSPLIEELNTDLLGHPNQNKFVERILDCDELEEYDVVLIDTHPSLDYVFQAVMTAAQYYIVPIFAEKHSISGLVKMFKKVEEVRKYLNSTLRLLGCVFTRYDLKNSTHVKFEKQIRAVSKTAAFKVFTTMIPNSVAVAGASASSQSLLNYKKSSPVTIAYMTLAGEMSPELRGRQRGKPRTVVKTDILQNEIPPDESEAGIDL